MVQAIHKKANKKARSRGLFLDKKLLFRRFQNLFDHFFNISRSQMAIGRHWHGAPYAGTTFSYFFNDLGGGRFGILFVVGAVFFGDIYVRRSHQLLVFFMAASAARFSV